MMMVEAIVDSVRGEVKNGAESVDGPVARVWIVKRIVEASVDSVCGLAAHQVLEQGI